MASLAGDKDTGAKRSHDGLEPDHHNTRKRRRVHHALRDPYQRPPHVEPAMQDPVFAQGQLLRSIGAALVMVGFDSVKPSAMEMFRSHVEEYMLDILSHIRHSMHDQRRTKPTAYDYAISLAKMPNAAAASQLLPQLGLQVPPALAFPTTSDPPPPVPAPPDLSKLLEPLMTRQPPSYIPKHFPALPPRHAWESTDVFSERERDARKMREKATEEGMMAEQALRKLAAAAKAGAMKAERKRSQKLAAQGSSLRGSARGRGRVRAKEDTFAEVLKDLGDTDEAVELGVDGTDEQIQGGMDLGMPEGVIVNHNMAHWRKGGHRQSLHGFV